MRTVRIYQNNLYQIGESVLLSAEAHQHVFVVLRMQPGQTLTLFNGTNQEYLATLVEISKKHTRVNIDTQNSISRESPITLHLAQGLIKGDGMEWIIQKAVELGVTSITPLLTQHGAVKQDAARLAKKNKQWQGILISACEQCGRNTLPTLYPPVGLMHYLAQSQANLGIILDPTATENLQTKRLLNASEITLLVGPEGGFHAEEITAAHAHGFTSCRLGPRILRAETAALAGLSILQAIAGDLCY